MIALSQNPASVAQLESSAMPLHIGSPVGIPVGASVGIPVGVSEGTAVGTSVGGAVHVSHVPGHSPQKNGRVQSTVGSAHVIGS